MASILLAIEYRWISSAKGECPRASVQNLHLNLRIWNNIWIWTTWTHQRHCRASSFKDFIERFYWALLIEKSWQLIAGERRGSPGFAIGSSTRRTRPSWSWSQMRGSDSEIPVQQVLLVSFQQNDIFFVILNLEAFERPNLSYKASNCKLEF